MGKIIKRTIDIPLNALENMDERLYKKINNQLYRNRK